MESDGFPPLFLPCFTERMNQMIGEQQHSVWWENVLYEMTRERDVYVQDVGGRFWAEVDYIEDYERILEHRNIERIIPAQLEILRPGNQERSENEF